MKKICVSLFLFFLLFPTYHLFAQSIDGKITDSETGDPLRQATVSIRGTSMGRIAGNEGQYKFENLKPGTYQLKVSFIGYEPTEKEVTVKAGKTTQADFQLISKIYQQEQVLVTGNQVATTRELVPLTTSVVNEAEIENSSQTNILPLLSAKVPGMFVTQRGYSGFGVASGSAGQITIRGVGLNGATSEVLVMIDGQPQMMGLMGHPFPDSYVSSDLEKVEVIRGPGSLLYGTNAMGGVVNLITRKEDKEGFSGKIRGQYGSFNTVKAAGSAGYRQNSFNLFASYNYDSTDGSRKNSDFRNHTAYLKTGYQFNDHLDLVWDGSYVNFTAHDPGPVNASDPSIYSNNGAWNDIKRSNTTLTLSNHYDKADGKLKLFFNRGHHLLYDGWNSIDKNFGANFFQGLKLIDNNLIGIGIDWNRYGGKGSPVMVLQMNPNGPPNMVPSQYNDQWIWINETGIYSFVQQTFFGWLTANVGLRYQHHTTFGHEWIPQFALTFKTTGNSDIKLLASKGFRSPNVRELYLFPPANPDLQPESMWNYEVGYNQSLLNKKLHFGVDVYYLKGKNLIQLVPTGSFPPVRNENTGAFKHYGLELETKYYALPNLAFDANYSYLHMDTPKLAAPDHQLYFGVNYLFGKFTLNTNMQWISGLYTLVEGNTRISQNYLVVSGKLNYKVNKYLDVYISGDNLTGSNYEINYGYPMPGATVLGGVTLRF